MGRMGSSATIALAVGLVAAIPAPASGRTFVRLVAVDDDAPRLGFPAVRARIDAEEPSAASATASELAGRLADGARVRFPGEDEPADYDLVVRLLRPAPPEAATLPFTARLVAADTHVVWEIEGGVELEGRPPGADTWAAIARNVVARLIADGWIEAKFDPDHPPPIAPRLGRTD